LWPKPFHKIDYRVNRKYLEGLLMNPVPWGTATKLQRFIFHAARNVLKLKASGLESLLTAPASDPRPSSAASPSPKKGKLRRERLTDYQFKYLKDYFQV
jgi:hypothetical protein